MLVASSTVEIEAGGSQEMARKGESRDCGSSFLPQSFRNAYCDQGTLLHPSFPDLVSSGRFAGRATGDKNDRSRIPSRPNPARFESVLLQTDRCLRNRCLPGNLDDACNESMGESQAAGRGLFDRSVVLDGYFWARHAAASMRKLCQLLAADPLERSSVPCAGGGLLTMDHEGVCAPGAQCCPIVAPALGSAEFVAILHFGRTGLPSHGRRSRDCPNVLTSSLHALRPCDRPLAEVFRFAQWPVFGNFDTPRLAASQPPLLVLGCLDLSKNRQRCRVRNLWNARSSLVLQRLFRPALVLVSP